MKVYHKNSESMKEVDVGSVGLIVTSPPYPMIAKWDELFKNWAKIKRLKSYDESFFSSMHGLLGSVWQECYRILVPGGICCINIGDATRRWQEDFQLFPNAARITIEMERIGFLSLIPIIWKKVSNRPNAFLGSGFLPPNAYIAQDCEYILIFRKGSLRQFDNDEKENRRRSVYTKEERDKWFQQVWEIPGKKGAGKSSGFPEEVPRRLIRMFSVIGDVVVDPFCGKEATTGRMARELCRNFIGYDYEFE